MQWEEFRFTVRHLGESDQAAVARAFAMGQRAHEGQKRKSGDPYFSHPIAVAHILADLGGDRDTIIAGLLHDTVEDTPVTLQDIERAFGPGVATLIDGVTKLEGVDVIDKPGLDGQIETLRKMFTLMQQDVRIMVIKLADRLHNMQTIRYRSPASQMRIARETMDVYVKIADRLCMRDMRDDLESLCLATLEPELHQRLVALRGRNDEFVATLLPDLVACLKHHAGSVPFSCHAEAKTWGKLRMQLETEDPEPTSGTSLNVAIVCETVPGCYALLGALHQCWQREAMTFEDFINVPVVNGYKGLHTTMFLDGGTRIRCKIRTHDMEEYAHKGVTLRCFDGKAYGILDALPWTHNVANIAEDTKSRSAEFWNSLQSDILQESVVIYGTGGRSALVPSGSTVLDGAYFLLRSGANRTVHIRMNGRAVPFTEKIVHAATIDVELGPALVANLEWLHATETAFASSMIRTALSRHSREELVAIGQSIVENSLMEREKWYLDEFGQDLLLGIFRSLGYSSVGDAYVAVAEGRLDSAAVVARIAAELTSRRSRSERRERATVSFTVGSAPEAHALLEQMGTASGAAVSGETSSIRTLHDGVHATYGGTFDRETVTSFRRLLEAAGAENVTVRGPALGTVSLMLLVVFFWALNPVAAKWFFARGMEPLDLLTLRSLSFFALATCFLAAWGWMRGGLFAPIPRGTRLALLPALSSLLLTLCTYLSLSLLPASVHLTILRLNVFLLPLVTLLRGKRNKRVIVLSLATVSAGVALLTVHHASARLGIAFALASLCAYLLYSHVLERTMQRGKIGIRYPTFLFHMGWIFGIVGVALLPLLDRQFLTGPVMAQAFAYTLFCVFIPHACFHAVLQRARFARVTDLSLLEVPLAVAFEAAILGTVLPPTEYAVMTVVILSAVLFAFRGVAKTDSGE